MAATNNSKQSSNIHSSLLHATRGPGERLRYLNLVKNLTELGLVEEGMRVKVDHDVHVTYVNIKQNERSV